MTTSQYFLQQIRSENKSLCIIKFQDLNSKKKKLQYDRANLQRAFDATLKGMSVYRASRLYLVPESTLRDRTRGKVDMEPVIGFDTIFNAKEEEHLVEHVTYMASIGYGYNKVGIQHMARDYAVSLGKLPKSENSLSNCWFYGFLKRWPELTVAKPQKLSLLRARDTSKEKLDCYYKELSSIMFTHNLNDHPERIFNVDETGINTEHTPPKIVCNKNTKPQAVTSTRSATITIIAGGNALGNYIPPYYIFPGKRWNPEFLTGCLPGSNGEMSDSGWSNSQIFQNYVTSHFVKYAGVALGQNQPATLLLYDGHRSHINLTLTDWAKLNNVILFVLPPHTSHVTQPLDVGAFGPLKAMYNKECQLYLQHNPGVNVNKYQIAELTKKPYMRALSPENLISAFRKTGIYPLNCSAISESEIAPSSIYHQDSGDSVTMPTSIVDTQQPEPVLFTAVPLAHTHCTTNPTTSNVNTTPSDFFASRNILSTINRKKRKFVPPFITGNLMKQENQSVMLSSQTNKETSLQQKKSRPSTDLSNSKQIVDLQRPTTSGVSKKGGPINLVEDEEEDSDYTDNSDDEVCCVCGEWEPKELKNAVGIVFTKWAQCNTCSHWTHLTYCSKVRVVRLNADFKCPHCEDKH